MRTLLLLCCCLGVLAAAAQRQHRSLDDGWRFHFGNAADPSKDFNYGIVTIFSKSGKSEGTAIAPNFDDRDWREVSVPHDWAVELPFENSSDFDVMAHGYKPVGGHYPATSIGWYRKRFMVSPADSGQRFVLQFDGVFRDSKVWVNGFYCCANASGYSGFKVDVTDLIRYGRENVLVVRVDATQYEGWFYEGAGIYRHVWLNQYSPVHIAEDGLFVHSAVKGMDGKGGQGPVGQGSDGEGPVTEVTVETTVVNDKRVAAGADVAAYLTDREGKVIGRGAVQAANLGPGESKTVVEKIIVQHPVLWSPDQPYLYRAGAVIRSGGVVDEEKIRVGIRTIRIDSTGLYVNGRYTKIKGVCNHQDHAGVGSALPDYLQYYRARLLKQMGVNSVRTSHNPPTPEWLDACDSLGLLVLDENRLLNSGPEYLDQLRRLVFRDRSRASVFLWSLGNEEGYVQTRPVGREIALTMMARLKEWDPTRICTYAADVANVYQGINEVIPVRGFNYRIKGVDPYHKDHPGQPILGTEMGSTVTTRGIYEKDTVRCYVPDEDITAPWWANTAEQWWSLAADRPWWMGGFVWTGFDYRGEPTPYQWPNINSHFGVMDMCGFPKNIYYYYRSWWTDEDVLHISPHWNWKGKEGQPIQVWVNSNGDQVELFLNGKSLGKKEMPRNSHLEWTVPYEAGKLEAVAEKKGRKFSAAVETTGDPFEVVVTPYKTTILADGKDATVLNISVVDRQGREVPDAGNAIRFVAAGDLHIIGVGNGDPSSHEADKGEDSVAERHLWNGHAQVIVQAGVKPGMYHFTAASDGLQQGATDITTIVPGAPHSVLGWKPGGAAMGMDRSGAQGMVTGGAAAGWKARQVDKMLGADISFLPELESRGVKFADDKGQRDAIQILKDHGFNYIRLRIFNNPARDSGYSPGKGFCDLTHTMQMARRVKALGLHLLLDFHYSDTWADPGKQFKPAAWRGENFSQLQQSLYDYTKMVMDSLRSQGTLPDMVQIGNEINHGMVWPEGSIRHPDSLAALIYAGIRGVKAVDPACPVMLHIALGGQNDESHFFLDNMLERQVPFDVIGLSYYPKWHGTLADLKYNVDDLARQYGKDVIVVEYTQRKQEVNDIAFSIPGGRGKGTCIWEPLNTWEHIFERDGKANSYLYLYDELSKEFVRK
ncbi:MAG TPA: beta-galactosidase GalA [Puia sp.]|nr:beta-galactosidase GalA [Puia sp.]